MFSRRRFIAHLTRLATLAVPATAFARAEPAPPAIPRPSTLIQRSPVAGFQYHQGEQVWQHLQPEQTVTLVREADNRFDPNAVRIDWNGHKLGYLPRVHNTAVSQMLDRSEPLTARIVVLRKHGAPWQRMEVEVWLS